MPNIYFLGAFLFCSLPFFFFPFLFFKIFDFDPDYENTLFYQMCQNVADHVAKVSVLSNNVDF